MSDFTVDQIALDAAEAEQVTALINRSFPDNPDIGSNRVRENTEVSGDEPSVYVAAKIGSEIIGFNAFISHRLSLHGTPVLAFQSCWTATSNEHRGRGIFQRLINTGRDVMRARGAALVFGFPNRNSQPIFVHKLGFRERPSLKWRMPLFPFATRLWTNSLPSLETADSFLQDNRTLIELKKRTHGTGLVELHTGRSMMWGVRRAASKLGVPLHIFEIGGIDLDRPEDMRPLFADLPRQAKGCVAAQFATVDGSRYAPFFRHLKVTEPPFIVSDLNMDSTGLDFSFFSGIRDYF